MKIKHWLKAAGILAGGLAAVATFIALLVFLPPIPSALLGLSPLFGMFLWIIARSLADHEEHKARLAALAKDTPHAR